MRKRHFRLPEDNDNGAVLIEFALIVPILIFLILGIIEFGWIFNGYMTIKGAAREGARAASTVARFAESNTEIEDAVNIAIGGHEVFIENLQVQKVDYPVHHSTQGGKVYEGVNVTISGNVRPPIIFYTSFSGNETGVLSFSADATMRVR